MKMKKLLSLAMAGVLSASLLAGCGAASSSAAGTASGSGSAAGEEPITLKWSVWDIDATAYYQPLIDAYTAEHPNVTIEMVDLGSTDYQTVLATQLAGGADDLDIISVKDTTQLGGTVEQITVDGDFYALPFIQSFWVVFYNKDLFDAAGVEYPTNDMTLEEYDALARQLTSGEGAEKVYGCHYHNWRSCVQLFGILDGKNTIVDGTYDFLQPYYEMILAQQDDGICMDYATIKTGSIHYSGVFYNNQCAMMNQGSWFLATQIAAVKSGESLATNWGIVKYPHPEGVEAGTTLGTITSLGVNSKSANKQAAFAFIEFVAGEEGAKIVAETGSFPALSSDEALDIIASVDGFPTDENSREALNTVKTYLEMPMHEKSADIEVVLNQAHDNIMTENCTIEEGIQAMNEGVQAILNA